METGSSRVSCKTLRNYVALVDYLEALLKRKVDLLTIEGIDPCIQTYIEAGVIWDEE